MSDKHDDGKIPDAGPEVDAPRPAEDRRAGPVTRRDAFRRITSTVMGGVALAVGGPLVARKAHAAGYYSRSYSSYSSRSYSSYSSRSYSSYSSRSYSSYSSRSYSSYSSRSYSSYSSRSYSSISRQQEYRRQDIYRSQQNQVVKDSINKQIEQQKRNRYNSTAYYSRAATPYSSRAAYYSRAAYSSRSPYSSISRYFSTAYVSRAPLYTSRAATPYNSRAPLYTSRAPAQYASHAAGYTSRAPAQYASRITTPEHKSPVKPEAKAPPKGKTQYSSWYCSQGLWHRYSSLA